MNIVGRMPLTCLCLLTIGCCVCKEVPASSSLGYALGCVPVLVGNIQITLALNMTSSEMYIYSRQVYMELRGSASFDEHRQTDILNLGGVQLNILVTLNEADSLLPCQGSIPLGKASPIWQVYDYAMFNAGRVVFGQNPPIANTNIPLTVVRFSGSDINYQVELRPDYYKTQLPFGSSDSHIQVIEWPFNLQINPARYFVEGNAQNKVYLGRSFFEFGSVFLVWNGYEQDPALYFDALPDLLLYEEVDNNFWVLMLLMLFIFLGSSAQRIVYVINWVFFQMHSYSQCEKKTGNSEALYQYVESSVFVSNQEAPPSADQSAQQQPKMQLFFPRHWTAGFGLQGALTSHEINLILVLMMCATAIFLVLFQTGMLSAKLCLITLACGNAQHARDTLDQTRIVVINSLPYFAFGMIIYAGGWTVAASTYNRMKFDPTSETKLLDIYLPFYEVLSLMLWSLTTPLKPSLYVNVFWTFLGLLFLWSTEWGLAEVWLLDFKKPWSLTKVINLTVTFLTFGYAVLIISMLNVSPLVGLFDPSGNNIEVYFWLIFVMVGVGPLLPGIAALWLMFIAYLNVLEVSLIDYLDLHEEQETPEGEDTYEITDANKNQKKTLTKRKKNNTKAEQHDSGVLFANVFETTKS